MIEDLDVLSGVLEPLGYKLTKAEYGPMDSGVVIFSRGDQQIEITKDRGQWILSGSREELEPKGLWRAFDDIQEFKSALLKRIET